MDIIISVLIVVLIAAAALWLIDRVQWGDLSFVALILKVGVVLLALFKLLELID